MTPTDSEDYFDEYRAELNKAIADVKSGIPEEEAFVKFRPRPREIYGDIILSVQAGFAMYSKPKRWLDDFDAYEEYELAIFKTENDSVISVSETDSQIPIDTEELIGEVPHNWARPSDFPELIIFDPWWDEEYFDDEGERSSSVAGYVPKAVLDELRAALIERAEEKGFEHILPRR